MQHAVFAALFIVNDELYGDPRFIRPTDLRTRAVALEITGISHATFLLILSLDGQS
ncbi:hypothetical protein SAMCFNEI73_pC0875 (plasmid) [Sinorhizobium americanum]|uniref:Uncharacterized protein n=1 Tax=Sinorhizobium americanum TaxID=194963 RepID=A0A1L3LWW6_9HYPH|nr:hypothetical protein SAMCFNEI73_pC0875 [Sinorhizobium americanum]